MRLLEATTAVLPKSKNDTCRMTQDFLFSELKPKPK